MKPKKRPVIKPRKRLSVKKQLESTKGLTKRELVWAKQKRKKLKQVKSTGNKKQALIQLKDFPKSHFFIHQHLPVEKRIYSTGLPSAGDIAFLSALMRKGKAKTGVLASTNNKGKITGYTFFKLNKPLSKIDTNFLSMIIDNVFEKEVNARTLIDYSKTLKSVLKKGGYILTQKTVAIQGYKFNKSVGSFVKTRKTKSK